MMKNDDAVCRALEGYRITKAMKRTANYKGNQQNGTIHQRAAECPRMCALYEALVRTVIGPHILAEFEAEQRQDQSWEGLGHNGEDGHAATKSTEQDRQDDDNQDEEGVVLLYQFPPALRIYSSHIVYESDPQPPPETIVTTPGPLSADESDGAWMSYTTAVASQDLHLSSACFGLFWRWRA